MFKTVFSPVRLDTNLGRVVNCLFCLSGYSKVGVWVKSVLRPY